MSQDSILSQLGWLLTTVATLHTVLVGAVAAPPTAHPLAARRLTHPRTRATSVPAPLSRIQKRGGMASVPVLAQVQNKPAVNPQTPLLFPISSEGLAAPDLLRCRSLNPQVVSNGPVQEEETLMKILVVGDTGTGKTSFIKRYVSNIFTSKYKATIGVDFALKSKAPP